MNKIELKRQVKMGVKTSSILMNNLIVNVSKETPYFYFDKNIFDKNIKNYSNKKFQHYYSTKSCLFDGLIKKISKNLDGFTVSSIDYLKRVRSETSKPIHFVSPLIREQEIKAINSLGNSVTFNSLEQYKRLIKYVSSHIKVFIRINPEVSCVKDDRYNPSRSFSQLGVPLSQLEKCPEVDGIHFHNNSREGNPRKILKTIKFIEGHLKSQLRDFQYVNLGGGYLWSEQLIKILNKEQDKWKEKYKIKFIIEPGFDISNSAGFLVSSVVDLFERSGRYVVVLDTSINHLPKVFECQKSPEIVHHKKINTYNYILVGATCLAGDVFGEYRFKHKLSLGNLIIFKNVGAYSAVKAHKFNGIEIPKIYFK